MPTDQILAPPLHDFSRQIKLLRNLEPLNRPPFWVQSVLVITGCLAAYLIAGWWVCAVWSVIYLSLQVSEKLIVQWVPDNPPLPLYMLVLAVLTVEALVYCFLPIYLWLMGPDLAKFGALALITSSTMHSIMHRAAFPSILLCFLIPDAAVFAVIPAGMIMDHGVTGEAILYVVGGVAIVTFFMITFLQAYRKEQNARRETIERHEAESAREASEVRFKSLFESAPIPIREEDLSGMKRLIDGLNLDDFQAFQTYLDRHPQFLEACANEIKVLDANNASLEQHGYSDKSQMLAKVVRTLSPDAMKIVRKSAEAMHKGLRGISYETNINRVDGTVRTVAATWSVIPGHEGTYARILLSSLDMTEHRKSEEALRQAQKMEAVGQLTGGVAHDFNNLLTVIGGNIDLMEDETTYHPELAAPIKKSVERGAELTQRLLAFSRKQPLSGKAISIDDLVLDMNDLLVRSLGEEIVVKTDLKASLWSAFADPGQVEASLLNMALNSRDAMPGGGILTISSRKARITADDDVGLDPGDYVVLAISDNGVGMTQEVLNRAYEPFFTTKEVGKGSGLGLPSVYGFAKQSGGDAFIKSAPGEGTTVSLYLPRSKTDAAPDRVAVSSSRRVEGRGYRILILEDDPGVAGYLERLIASNGFDVVIAEHAEAAQLIVNAGAHIDVLISDVMLPGGMRGPEFAAGLLERSPDTGVVFISGRPSEAHLEDYPSLHAASLLQKPFARDQLMQKIEASLKVKVA